MSDLRLEVKQKLIAHLKLEDISTADIVDSAPLFDGWLGLDSIDALELAMILDKDYGIVVKDSKDGKTAFASIDSMVKFIETHRSK